VQKLLNCISGTKRDKSDSLRLRVIALPLKRNVMLPVAEKITVELSNTHYRKPSGGERDVLLILRNVCRAGLGLL
jgi:hypothetical protein